MHKKKIGGFGDAQVEKFGRFVANIPDQMYKRNSNSK